MKGTKNIRWGTPKHIQRLKEGRPTFKSTKKKKYCSKTKGEHEVVWSEWQENKWWSGSSRRGKCALCGKKFYESKHDK